MSDALKIFTAIFMILLSSSAYAISLGSVQKNDFAEIGPLESAKFKMLFWNVENASYAIRLSAVEYPKGWTVIIDPSEFPLDRDMGEEYMNLPYMLDGVRAKTVNIFVKPAENSHSGTYQVTVMAETEVPEMKTSGMVVVSEKLFRFKVRLSGLVSNEMQAQEGNLGYAQNQSLEGHAQDVVEAEHSSKIDFYAIVVFLVLMLSIILYKKYDK